MGRTEQDTFKLNAVSVKGLTETEKGECPTKRKVRLACTQTEKAHMPIPRGLVGTKCTAKVLIAGKSCSCLLDTGSQVTTIPQSFYQAHLSDQAIQPITNLLEVAGANGQPVPYEGYVEVNVTFPKELSGTKVDISTLALVVPDFRPDESSQVLIGTNTLDVLYERCHLSKPPHRSSPYGYQAVLKVLSLREKQATSGMIGTVTWKSKEQKIIPAGQTVCLQGIVHSRVSVDRWAVVEPPSTSTLPGGILVSRCVLTIPSHTPYRLPVILKNETSHEITIPNNRVIAELHSVQSVTSDSAKAPDVNKKPNQSRNLTFSFGEMLPVEWQERISTKLNDIPEVFAQHDLDFGHTQAVKHHIKLHDETPFKHKARPIHPQDLEAVRKHLRELVDAGVIRESESPFSSPIVVVRKKNGEVRLCIDYRRLNLQTIKDAYALPNLEETFTKLTGSEWFSVLDLKSGYYQIEMAEADKPKTAFVCPLGFWEFNRMPQGITNAPSTFQRLMERCVGEMNLRGALVFLDDIIVFSKSLEEHEERLIQVLNRLKDYGLKLSPEKCKLFQTSVRYLGHIVSRNGVETDPEKIAALKTWPRPQNLKELRSFLGFSGYYRRFVKDYSKIVKPLNDLTSGYPPLRKGSKTSDKDKKYRNPKEPFQGRWTSLCQQAFETIIESLTTAPVLGFADPKLPYILHTDASTTGIGAALYQDQGDQRRVIAFASRGLTCSEARYPAHKLEFLALKWAVVDKFNDYLYGNTFSVITDSNPLTYILTSAKLDATSYRWLSALSTFSFSLQYRAGKQNLDADALSRRPHGDLVNDPISQKESERIRQFALSHQKESSGQNSNQEVVKAICEKHVAMMQSNFALVESLALNPCAIPDELTEEQSLVGCSILPQLSNVEIAETQRADQILAAVINQLETGEKPSPTLRQELPDIHLLLREWKKLELRDNILYRRRQGGDQTYYQLVLPSELRPVVLQHLHDDMGHMGVERTLDLIRSRFYWPRMATDVERKVQTCDRCVRRKALPEKAAPLVNVLTSRPLELVCIDFLSIEPDSRNKQDVLVITDHFTKYAVAVPTQDQKARTVAKCLWDVFIVHYGLPERLHSDQGADFESHLVKELCALAGIQKCRTSPYHPRGNPVERFNRTLLSMLGTLKDKQKSHWSDYVKALAHAYNCTKNEVTGFSPYELMFGRQPRLPVDLAFGLPVGNKRKSPHSQYVKALKSHLEESYRLATQATVKSGLRNKARFDKMVTESTLEVGDRVLVRNVRVRGKHKLADKWEPAVHIVVKRAGELPVYTVRPENEEGRLRTLHRDLLLPCGFLPAVEQETHTPPTKPKRPRTRQTPFDETSDCISDLEDESSDQVASYGFSRLQPSETVKITYEYNTAGTREKHKMSRPQNAPDLQNLPVTVPDDSVVVDSQDRNPAEETVPNLPTYLPQSTDVESLPFHGPTRSPVGEKVTSLPRDLPQLADAESLPVSESPEEESNGGKKSLPMCTESGLDVANTHEKDRESQALTSPVDERNSSLKQTESELNSVNNADIQGDNPVRRSSRERIPTRKFHYPELGNPLVSVVTSLFQGLNTAIVRSLNGMEIDDYGLNISVPLMEPVTCQPNTYAPGRAHV